MWAGRLGLRPPAAPPPTAPAPAPAPAPPPFRLVTDVLAAGANAQRDMFQTDTNSTDSYTTFIANETNSTWKGSTVYEESYEHRVAAFLCLYYTPLLICLGCVGNLMSLFVFYRTKLRFQSTSQYLSALAVADTAFLLLLLPPWLHTVEVTGLFSLPGFCQLFVYATYVSCCVSAWLVVAFTVERFVAVLYPFRRNVVCTVKRARYTIYSIVLVSIVLNLPMLKLVLSSREECLMDQSHWRFAAIFNAFDTVVTFTLPLAVIIVLNAWIMIGVWRLERTRQQLLKTSTSTSTSSAPTRHRYGRGRRAHARVHPPHGQCQRRVTKMLLIVSSVFVLLNLPAYTMRILAYAYETPEYEYSARWKAIQQVALMFFNTNYGINFLLYCLTGQKFRRALVGSLPCAKRRARLEEAQRFVVSCRPVRASSISTSLASCSEPTNTATTNVTTNVQAVVTSVTGVTSVTSVTGEISMRSVRCRRRTGLVSWIAYNRAQRQQRRRRDELEMAVFHQQTTQAQIHGTCSTDA